MTLSEYLATDPDALGFASLDPGNHAGRVELANAPFGNPVPGIAEKATVEAVLDTFLTPTNSVWQGLPVWIVIEDVASGAIALPAGSEALRVACRMCVRAVKATYRTLDFSLPAVQQFLGGLVAGDILTAAQRDELVALSHTLPSSAERRLGRKVTLAEVSDVLNGGA